MTPVRLQVVLDAKELAEIQRFAKQQRMTTAAWVRQTLRAARRAAFVTDPARQVALVRDASTYPLPAPEFDPMLREIERGSKPWLALRGMSVRWTGDPLAPAVDPGDIEALR